MKIRLIALILCGLLLAAPTMRTADAEAAASPSPAAAAAPSPAGGGKGRLT